MTRKILVTGPLGHIGSHLLHNLSLWTKKTDTIIAVDDFSTQRYCTLFNLPKKIEFVESNFNQINIEDVDIIIHLAAVTDATKGDKKKIEEVNIQQTKSLLNRIMLHTFTGKRKLLVFPSSTSVYGSANTSVMTEDNPNCINPQSPYAESKIEIEKEIKKIYSHEDNNSKFNFLIFRWGTIFGMSPGARFHTAINKFCLQAALGFPTVTRKPYFFPFISFSHFL